VSFGFCERREDIHPPTYLFALAAVTALGSIYYDGVNTAKRREKGNEPMFSLCGKSWEKE